ncbi:MAG: hypothetical protein H3C34_01550 [Caldilineaceae bacterium]|nr:hypothetical protein [Caldilineaceae bacterium]
MIVATIRDIVIIFLAVESIVVTAMLGILIWQIWRLTRMIQNEVKPIIRDTQDTLSTVRGTTHFMSDHVVMPVVETSSKLAGVRRTAQVLMEQLPRRSSKKQPPSPQQAASPVPEAPAGSQTNNKPGAPTAQA